VKPIFEHDYYETLEVGREAAPEEIERAYKLALLTYSEDSLAGYSVFEEGDVELMRERIEVAYQTLSDLENRRSYDLELGHLERLEPPQETSPTAVPAAPSATAPLEPVDDFEELDGSDGDWTGARLRRARMRCGVEYEAIANTTKVNPEYLKFIEDERFDDLPAAVYVRGFVMGYASCVELDGKKVAASYMERYQESRDNPKRRLFSRR